MAGLFGDYFDPQSYSASGGILGGLYDRLLEGALMPNPGGPVTGNAMGQATLPRIPYTDAAELQAPVASSAASAPQSASPDIGLGDRLGAGFLSWANTPQGNLFAGLGNLIQGLATGKRVDPLGQAQQLQEDTFKYLVKAGTPPEQAILIAQNPAVMTAYATEMVKPQLQHVTIKGRTGEDVPVTFNPRTGAYTDASGKPLTGVPNANASNLTGQAYLESLPLGRQNTVKGMLEGRIAPAQLGRSGTPAVQSLLEDAAIVEPGFDLTKWTTRNKTAMDFSSGGKSGQAIRSAQQGLNHVDELMKSVDELSDTGSPMLNSAVNNIKMATIGNPPYRQVMVNAHAVADEFSKMWKNGHNSDAEIRQWESGLSPNMTKAEWQSQIRKLMSLLGGSLDSYEQAREAGMRTGTELPALLNEKSREIMQRASKWGIGSSVQKSSNTTSSGVTWSIQ